MSSGSLRYGASTAAPAGFGLVDPLVRDTAGR
jgi:hypothetical protein